MRCPAGGVVPGRRVAATELMATKLADNIRTDVI
jgi:hypothetical protein